MKKKSIFLILIVSILALFFIRAAKKGERTSCGKYVYYKRTGQTIDSTASAIEVFRPILKSEKKYRNYEFPSTYDDFMKKYNKYPFMDNMEVLDNKGKSDIKEVYNMLLAYLIDKDGNIYKYNMCSYFFDN